MTESSVWMVDHLAAERVARQLDISMTENQMQHLADIFAEHRLSTLELGITRVQTRISVAIQEFLRRNLHRSGEWSDGFRSAEAMILTAISSAVEEMKPRQQRSKGQLIRSLLRQARSKKAACDPIFSRIEAPMIVGPSHRS